MRLKIEREKLFWLIGGLRAVLLRGVIVAAVLTGVSFFFAKNLLLLLARHTHTDLYYFTLSEVFFSTVEMAIYAGLFLSVPAIMFFVWRQFRESVSGKIGRAYVYAVFAVFLFYLGCVFCFYIVLPNGIGFLLSYQGGPLKAMISTDRFVHFCITMVFAFGASFELPIVLLVLGKLGVVTSGTLTRTRRYAILIIVIAASVITPTPDIYNMSLLAVPLYVLYEIGILLLKIGERKRRDTGLSGA
jgi:sec-independent protein translocase protein TatC